MTPYPHQVARCAVNHLSLRSYPTNVKLRRRKRAEVDQTWKRGKTQSKSEPLHQLLRNDSRMFEGHFPQRVLRLAFLVLQNNPQAGSVHSIVRRADRARQLRNLKIRNMRQSQV